MESRRWVFPKLCYVNLLRSLQIEIFKLQNPVQTRKDYVLITKNLLRSAPNF